MDFEKMKQQIDAWFDSPEGKALIDFINNEINEVKKPKVKKEISYIKYP